MIRPAAPDDAPAIAALIRLAFAQPPVLLDPPPSALRETTESVAAHLARGGGAVMDGVRAAVLWEERGGDLYVHRLAVHPDWRRHGYARALMAAAEAEARRRGLPRLHLGVRLALAGNRALFASLGFRETVQHRHDGYRHPTWTEAEKSL